MLPAAPLDGGRVLRAALWHRTGDLERAAVTAARSGRVFGFLLAGLGLLQTLFTETWNGIGLVLAGWFLVSAATAEEQQARTTSKRSGLRANDMMTRGPVVADASMHLDVFVDRLAMNPRCTDGRGEYRPARRPPLGQPGGPFLRQSIGPPGTFAPAGPVPAAASIAL